MRQSRAFLYGKSIGGGFDVDAQSFIDAAGITDVDQQSYLNTLVLELKNNNIWDKIRCFYPMIGSTSFNHKFNLKDPRDLNEAFRLDFVGGTHSVNGWNGDRATTNESARHANTHFVIGDELNLSSCGMTVTLGNVSGSIPIGANNPDRFALVVAPTVFAARMSNQIARTDSSSLGNGIYTQQKISASVGNAFRNGNKIIVDSNFNGALPNYPFYLNVFNNGGSLSNQSQYLFYSVAFHEGFTDLETIAFHSIINDFEINLNRKTW